MVTIGVFSLLPLTPLCGHSWLTCRPNSPQRQPQAQQVCLVRHYNTGLAPPRRDRGTGFSTGLPTLLPVAHPGSKPLHSGLILELRQYVTRQPLEPFRIV